MYWNTRLYYNNDNTNKIYKIYLVESPIDALSFMDLYMSVISGTLLSTHGEMMLNKVINYIIFLVAIVIIII